MASAPKGSPGPFRRVAKKQTHHPRLPRWLQPGVLTISHVDLRAGRFAFVLALRHPVFGEVLYQSALFQDRVTPILMEIPDD